MTAVLTRSGQIVSRYYADIDLGDVDTALSKWAPEAVYRRPGYPALSGLDEIRAFYLGTRVIACGKHTIEETLATDDAVAVRGFFTGQGRDGGELSVRFSDFWRLVDGLVVERNTYFDAPAV